MWGQGRFNQLGLGATVSKAFITEPVVVPGLGRVSALSCGGNFNLSASTAGVLAAWGANGNGELGGGGGDAS